MNIYNIYKATNQVNGKVYIGFTNNFNKRRLRHNNVSLSKNNVGYNDVFHKAIRKYGADKFKWDIIYCSTDGNHCKDFMEPHFIKYNNSFVNSPNSNGYNMTLGGDGMLGFTHTEETKNNQSILSGKPFKFWKNSGELVEGINLKKYCDNNDLHYNSMVRVNSGSRLIHKTYIRFDNEETFDIALDKYNNNIYKSMSVMGDKHSKSHLLLSPEGIEAVVQNLQKFSRDNGLNPASMKHLSMGKSTQHMGWKYLRHL